LDESRKEDSIQNCLHKIDTVQILSETDIKKEIKEECVPYLDEEVSPYKHNLMVCISSLNLPMINEPDKSEQYAVVDKIPLLNESADKRKGLKKSKSSKSNNIKPSAIVLDLPEIALFGSNV